MTSRLPRGRGRALQSSVPGSARAGTIWFNRSQRAFHGSTISKPQSMKSRTFRVASERCSTRASDGGDLRVDLGDWMLRMALPRSDIGENSGSV